MYYSYRSLSDVLFLNRESRRKTPAIVAIKGKDREFGEAAISRVRTIDMICCSHKTVFVLFSQVKSQGNLICIYEN